MTDHEILRHPEALARIAASLAPLESTQLPLENAFGRLSSKDIQADRNLPDVDRALMDGYALFSGDTVGATTRDPARLALGGVISSATTHADGILTGQAARILTGGPIPRGADTVIREEDVKASGDHIFIDTPVMPGRHIAGKGSQIAQGDVVVRAGAPLTPAVLQAMAALRIDAADVSRAPRVGVLAVGSELTDFKHLARDEQIVAGNLYMLSAMVSECGGLVESLAVCGDETEAIQAGVRKALESDVVITTGGSANSPSDLTRAALEAMGVRLSFTGLAMRPGKSAGFGLYGPKPVFVLPGPPVAVFTVFYALVRPALLRLMGNPTGNLETVSARLDRTVQRRPGTQHWLQGIVYEESGRLHVRPLLRQEVRSFSALIRANGLIPVDSGKTRLRAGSTVSIHLLPGREGDLSGLPSRLEDERFAAHPPLIAIVGKSNAGKTTFLERLIKTLTARGHRVGTIKHNPHGFDIDREGKDSWRHKQAGALTVAVSSPRGVALIRDLTAEETPEALASSYFADMDLVLTEGYKALDVPKIEVFRSAVHDVPLCREDPRLVAFISDIPMGLDTPSFGLEDIDGVADLVEKTYLINP